ncbi:MAG: Mov34/MPN/PAD-1 family protein [Gammaproteobacteria bacterium]|nr:Mov34/MPN/PAD-1 family protein [Gammaproteobacteria bacterium]
MHKFDRFGWYDGGHEGICYWAGREEADLTHLKAVLVPKARHDRYGVFVSEAAFGEVARKAREMGLGILAQVHSHPDSDTRHSDGDDELVVLPFENMLSLVAPYYGRTLKSISDFSVHQFQSRRWVLCSPRSVSAAFEICSDHD